MVIVLFLSTMRVCCGPARLPAGCVKCFPFCNNGLGELLPGCNLPIYSIPGKGDTRNKRFIQASKNIVRHMPHFPKKVS